MDSTILLLLLIIFLFVSPFLFVLLKHQRKIVVKSTIGAIIILLYLLFGIPFISCPPPNNFRGVWIGGGIIAEHKLYKNAITGRVKEMRGSCAPIGWKYYKSTFDLYTSGVE